MTSGARLDANARRAFDAASIPGMRARLAALYAEFRKAESEVNVQRAPPEAGGSIGAYRERDCPLCGRGREQASVECCACGLTVVRCETCGFVYSRNVLEERSDAERYQVSDIDAVTMRLRDSDAYLELESARSRYYLDLVSESSDLTRGSLLEIGCGSGAFLVEARRRGWTALGVEPGVAAAAQARSRGVTVLEGYFPHPEIGVERRFDLIAMLDVLEHMADPRPFLRKVKAQLAPNGALFIQVPNWDSLLIQAEGSRSTIVSPGHWSYFNKQTLTALLESEGFKALRIETVVSELDRIANCPAAAVEAAFRRLRPRDRFPADAEDLYRLDLGYKLIGTFRSA